MKPFLLILNILYPNGEPSRVSVGVLYTEALCTQIGGMLSQRLFMTRVVAAVNFECIPQLGA